jgi:hypothetical protein
MLEKKLEKRIDITEFEAKVTSPDGQTGRTLKVEVVFVDGKFDRAGQAFERGAFSPFTREDWKLAGLIVKQIERIEREYEAGKR